MYLHTCLGSDLILNHISYEFHVYFVLLSCFFLPTVTYCHVWFLRRWCLIPLTFIFLVSDILVCSFQLSYLLPSTFMCFSDFHACVPDVNILFPRRSCLCTRRSYAISPTFMPVSPTLNLVAFDFFVYFIRLSRLIPLTIIWFHFDCCVYFPRLSRLSRSIYMFVSSGYHVQFLRLSCALLPSLICVSSNCRVSFHLYWNTCPCSESYTCLFLCLVPPTFFFISSDIQICFADFKMSFL